MRYTSSFKSKVAMILSGDRRLPRIIKAINHNDHDTVRVCLEDALDDISLYDMKNRRRDGTMKIHPLKEDIYNERKELYDEFMIEYDNYLHSKVKETGDKLIHERTRIQK